MAFDLSGRVALVTGGGRGIGAAICRSFAEAGAFVIIANRSVAPAEALAEDLDMAEAVAFRDLSRPGLTALVDDAVARHGRLDILVHNAGGTDWTAIADLDEQTLAETIALNLTTFIWLAQAARPHMASQGWGRLLATSSVTGPKAAMPGTAHYAAAKAGLNGFIRTAALEFARDGITVNGVEPGFIDKPTGSLFTDPEKRARIESYMPGGRLGRAEDIAAAMLYLAAPEAQFVTGQTIAVDGGALLPETHLGITLLDRLD